MALCQFHALYAKGPDEECPACDSATRAERGDTGRDFSAGPSPEPLSEKARAAISDARMARQMAAERVGDYDSDGRFVRSSWRPA